MEASYTIERAKREYLDALPGIEQQAASLFRGWNVPEALLEATTSLEEFRTAQAAGLLWVAVSPQQQPIGFALLEREGRRLHLEELDVHPRYGRRGIGRALVERICVWAQEQGYAELTLTTYREIPWNEPFYSSLGFKALGATELSPALQERVMAEAARGLDPAFRVVMRKELRAG